MEKNVPEKSPENFPFRSAKCEHCGYEWYTRSEREHVTCPSCNGRVKLGKRKA
jgi:predicted Zn-ribbon and HTH transcriptional regulator